MTHNKFIEYWRGIAVLIVVLYHYTNRLPHQYYGIEHSAFLAQEIGKIGVLIFFIISGYLISLTLSSSDSLSVFFAKRISRIWPLFVVANIFTFIFLLFFPAKPYFADNNAFYTEPRDLVDLIGSILFMGDWAVKWIDGIYWSILVEVKFYFYIGFFAVIFREKFRERFCAAAIAIGLIEAAVLVVGRPEPAEISMIVTHEWRQLSHVLHGVFISQYLPFFAIGVALSGENAQKYLTPNIVIACIVAMIVVYEDGFVLIDTLRFLAVTAFAIAVDLFLLKGRIGAFIGVYSYSIYLFHQMFGIQITRWLTPVIGFDLAITAALLLTLMLSTVAAKLFEWRYRRQVTSVLVSVFDRLGLGRLQPSVIASDKLQVRSSVAQ